jgi:competence protein ComEA
MTRSIRRGLVRALAVAFSLSAASLLHAQGATATAPAKKKAATAATVPAPATDPVDINHATVDQLKAVKGIGDTYAAKIIAGRPYANKTQLQSKKILPASVYKKVAAMLVAKQ